MKFTEMPYTRPDADRVKAETERLAAAIRDAETFDAADAAFKEYETLSSNVETNTTLAFVRHDINTEDEFYDAEVKYLDSVLPVLEESAQDLKKALYESRFRPEFEAAYGSLMFKNIGISLKSFSPEIIPELQQENALVTEYGDLIASAQIDFDGSTYTLSQLTPLKQDASDDVRLRAWIAEGQWYKDNDAAFDRIYDELVHLRDAMARKLGYDSYTQLGYYRMMRNSYTEQEVASFRHAVKKHLVPVADKLMRAQAERIGADYPLNFAMAALEYKSGNAKPQGTAEDIMAQGKKFYSELSPETKEFFDFMLENELFDVLSKKGKTGGGYCTGLPDYKCPFIFANFNGTQGDVEVITHEAGHAFADFRARDMFPSANRQPTLESCEIHSMSMEFFAWPWAEGFFGEDTDKFYYTHLANAVTFIPYGTMVDEFQHEIYADPGLTPKQRHGIWRRLLGEYMPWMKLGDIPFYGDGEGWQRQMHIYQVPFYYIDYCLAQSVALQFWTLMQKDRAAAWDKYLKLVSFAGKKTFTELVIDSGLENPFGDDALKLVSVAAVEWLEGFDKSKLV